MRMDGDPHLTNWGSLDAEPIGGQRAIDLIPPQVVGGFFLMGTDEKGRISQPSRQEIPDKQGGPVPKSCQRDEPWLQPLGVLEDQLAGGNCQPGEENAPLGVVEGQLTNGHCQPGEENVLLGVAENLLTNGHCKLEEDDGPLALPNLDSFQDSAENHLSYCTFESPPVACVPPEPLSSSPLSQTTDQNVLSPVHSSQGDCPSDYLLDIPQLLVPGLVLPSETDTLPHCPLVSATDAIQMPVPSNGLLDLNEKLLFTYKIHQESDCKPLSFDYLTPETDQIPPAVSCLPRIDDHSLVTEGPVAPCPDQSTQLDVWVDPMIVESAQSESSLDFGEIESPQPSSWFDSGAQLPHSESCFEPDTVQLPHSTIHLKFDTDHLSHSQSNFCSDPFPQCECSSNSDVDELPEAETCLNLFAAELPEAESSVLSDTDELAEAETFLILEGDLPEAEACLNLSVSELPESDTCLSPGIGDLPEAESFTVSRVSELPEAESFLHPDVNELPEAEAGLNVGSELSEAESGSANITDYLSQSESSLLSDLNQLPQSDSCLDSEQLSMAISCLYLDTDQFSCPESCLDPVSDLLPQSEPCFTTDADQLPQTESHLHSANYKLTQPISYVDHNINHLKSHLTSVTEWSDRILDQDTVTQLPQAMACWNTNNALLPQLEYSLHKDSGSLSTFNSFLNPELDQSPKSEPFSKPDVDQNRRLSHSETSSAADIELFSKDEMLSHSECDSSPNSDHSAQFECCPNSQNDKVPDVCLDHNTKSLTHCDSILSPKTDQWPLSDPCSQADLNHSAQSDCLLIPKFAQCSQSELCLDTDELSRSNSYLKSDTVHLSQNEFSLVSDSCESPVCGVSLTPVVDILPQSDVFLDSDIELLPLSETFLAHENDQLICSISESGSELMSHSEISSTDQMPLFSDLVDEEIAGSEAFQSDHSVTCKSPFANQLTITESDLCDDDDDDELFCLCDTFLAWDPDQISLPALPEASDPDNLPFSESVLVHESDQLAQSELPKTPDIDCLLPSAFDLDHLHLGESFLRHDDLPFTMATSTDHLAVLHADSEHLLKLESNDGGQDSVSNSSVSHHIHEVPPSDPPLPSHVDPSPPSESFFAMESTGDLPLCKTTVANASHLPLLKSYLDLDEENLSKFNSSVHNHLPLSDSPLEGDVDQFIEYSTSHTSDQLPQSESFHGIDLLNLSECLLTPNLDELNLSDLCLSPDIDHFPLDVTPVDPCNEISLFDEFMNSNADRSLLPESIVMPNSDEMSLFESYLENDADHFLLSHMSVPPREHQLPFSDLNALFKEDNVQLCQSLKPQNVDPPMSEPLEDSGVGHDPQSVSYMACEVDQPESVYKSSLDSASDFARITPANTSFSNSIVEEFHIPWEWTSDLDHTEFKRVGFDCGSDIYSNVSPGDPDDSANKIHDIDDCFPLFCLDTPPESPIESPEIDPLTLSDDLLSLCDVFSHLHTNDMVCPETVDRELCCALDSLSLHQTDGEFRGDQVPIIEEEILSQLNDSQPDNLPHASDDPVDLNIGYDQTLNGIDDLKPLVNDIDQSDSYCLELLFEPKLVSQETRSIPSSPSVDPSPQFPFDPSFRSIGSGSVAGHLVCDVTKPSQSQESGSPLHNIQLSLSTSDVVTEMGSVSGLLGETVQLPMVMGKDPLELLDDLTEANQDLLLPKSQEALPPDKLVQPKIDTSIQDGEVLPCDLKGPVFLRPEELDSSQVSARFSDSSARFPPNDTTHPKPNVGFESPSCGAVEPIENLALSHKVSPLENTQVLPCDSHQPTDSEDSASAPFSFGEGDPFLGFALDNDSPCVGDELARLRAVFDALDRDKDGFVKMEDFVQFATVYGAEQVKYLTGYLDPAGLGVINFRDFYRGISEIQNEDLDMQLYDMGYPSEGEPACSVDFDDLAAFEVTEVTDSAYVGSESAYSECETFTDEDTGGLAAQEDQETEGDGAGSRRHTSASPEGLELSLCEISVVTVAGQEEQFEDFGEGAEPDLFNSHCEDEADSFTQTSNSTQHITSSGAPVSERQLLAPPSCSALGGMYCSQCHKHINRLEDLSTRLRYLEMDSPDKRTCSRKEARRLHHSGFLEEEPVEKQQTDMAYDDTDLTDKVVYLEQRVSELERDAATTSDQQNRLRQENLQLLHRAHALEEQLKDQELQSDEVQSEETRKHRDELRKMERDRSYRLTSLKARLQELENENLELRSQLPSTKAATQRLEEEKLKLLDQVEDLQLQLQDHQEQNMKLGGKLSKEMHKQQAEKERCQEIIEELRRELEQMQLMRLEMEQRMGLGNSAALQEYNSRTREAELEQEVRRLKQEQRALKEQNEELNGQIINLSIQGAKNLFSTTFSDSLAAEISSVSRDELMEAIQKQEEINLRLQDYIDRIIVAIMETNPAILEVKIH